MMDALFNVQQWIYAAVGGHLNAIAASHDWAALLAIMPLGVMFGAVHALTPGHSKTLLASYLIGSRLALLRALSVSSALAMTHVLSSVLIALFAAHLITRTLVGAGRALVLEDVSRGIMVLVGIWFVVRALRGRTPHARQRRRRGRRRSHSVAADPVCDDAGGLQRDSWGGVAFAGAMTIGWPDPWRRRNAGGDGAQYGRDCADPLRRVGRNHFTSSRLGCRGPSYRPRGARTNVVEGQQN